MEKVIDAKKKNNYKSLIAYDLLLTVGVPLNILCITLASANAERINYGLIMGLYGVLATIYWMLVLILGIHNIIQSFRKYNQGDKLYCLNAMLILKYGLVIFFIVNFLVIVLLFMAFGIIALMGSRGAIIFAFPVLAPWLVFIIFVCVAVTWLIMLPGSFYALQVIRFSLSLGKITIKEAILHGLLQFIFLLDVLDALYLSVKKWHRGKKSSLFIGLLYIIVIAAIIALIFYIVK